MIRSHVRRSSPDILLDYHLLLRFRSNTVSIKYLRWKHITIGLCVHTIEASLDDKLDIEYIPRNLQSISGYAVILNTEMKRQGVTYSRGRVIFSGIGLEYLKWIACKVCLCLNDVNDFQINRHS